jgi:hypothetical protein
MHQQENVNNFTCWLNSVLEELANVFVIQSKDVGSNLSIDKDYLLVMFVWGFNSNMQGVNSWALLVDNELS